MNPYAFYEALPEGEMSLPSFPVSSGQSVTFQTVLGLNYGMSYIFTNETTGASVTAHETITSSRFDGSSAEWVDERTAGYNHGFYGYQQATNMPGKKEVNWTQVAANNTPGDSLGSGYSRDILRMVDADGTYLGYGGLLLKNGTLNIWAACGDGA